MANELTLNASMNYADSESADETIEVVEKLASVATKRYTKVKQNIGTSEEAINLGDISAPGWVLLRNRDETNYIEIKVATSAAIFAKLLPGEFCFLRLGSGAQAPYAIANTAACQLEIFIAST